MQEISIFKTKRYLSEGWRLVLLLHYGQLRRGCHALFDWKSSRATVSEEVSLKAHSKKEQATLPWEEECSDHSLPSAKRFQGLQTLFQSQMSSLPGAVL